MSNVQPTTLIATAVVASLPIIPVLHFLNFGWDARRSLIVSRFTNEAITYYRQMFCPHADFNDWAGFARDYDLRFGWQLFLFPVMAFFAAVTFFSYLSMDWLFSNSWFDAKEPSMALISIASFAGAYVWVTYDLITRVRQNDVVTSDINRATLRFLIALPFGFAISAFAGAVSETVNVAAAPLAFFVGAFPTDSVLKFMRRTAGTYLKLDTSSGSDDKQDTSELLQINGINVPIAERFTDEGIKTILQLAYADPVALTIKSGMDFSFILDCGGQALVAIYFEAEQIKLLRKYGLRTSIEIKSYCALLGSETKDAVGKTPSGPAHDQLSALAKELSLDASSASFKLQQIADDPYAAFAAQVWETDGADKTV